MPRINVGYTPRIQFVPFHKRKQRWAIGVCHRRAGKSVACIADLIDAALRCNRQEPRFAYVAPTYTQAKDVAWTYLKRYTAPIPGVSPHESELRVDLPGDRRIRLYGADNYDRMRGLYFDGVVLDEFGDMDPRAWPEVIRPALTDRQGWAAFIGTPRGNNHFAELWDRAKLDPDWFTLQLKASETGLLSAAELADARRVMSADQYAAEYECSFAAAIIGAYYARELEAADADKRIGRVPYDPAALVTTAWDLGFGDSTAIWFAQIIGRSVNIIDYLSSNGVGLDWYAKQLTARPYVYHRHILPHDGAKGELIAGSTIMGSLRGLLGSNVEVLPRVSIEDGINAARVLFAKCYFDAEKCQLGLKALRNYHRAWNDKRAVFADKPEHDWSSDGADAFRYLAMGLSTEKRDDRWSRPIQYPKQSGIV